MRKFRSCALILVGFALLALACTPKDSPAPTVVQVDPEALYEQGKRLLSEGQIKAAFAKFETLTRLKPDFAEGWLHLGLALNALGKPQQAETALMRALKIGFPQQAQDPHFVCLSELLVAQLKQNRVSEARKTFDQLLGLGVRIGDAAGRAIALLLEVGAIKDAEWFVERTLQTTKNLNCYFYAQLALLKHKSGDNAAAFELLQKTGCATSTPEAKKLFDRLKNRFRRGSHFPIPETERQAKRLSTSSQENLSFTERKRACTILATQYRSLANADVSKLTEFVKATPLLRQSALGFNYLACIAHKTTGYKACLEFFPESEETLRDFCLAQVFWSEMLEAGVYGTSNPDYARLERVLNLARKLLPPGRFDKEVAEALLSRKPPNDEYGKRDAYSYMDFKLLRDMFAPHSGACNEFPDEAGRATCRLWKHILQAIHGISVSDADRNRLLEECRSAPLTPDLFVEIYIIIYAYTQPSRDTKLCKQAFFEVAPRYCQQGAEVTLPNAPP